MSLKPWYKIVTPREDLREGKPLDAAEFEFWQPLLVAFFEAGVLLHQPLAVARDQFVKSEGLPDQIGDHRQKADVVIESNARAAGVDAIDCESAHDRVAVLDWHADQ